jgi:hypothetical protein
MTDSTFLIGRAILASGLLAVLFLPITTSAEDNPVNAGSAPLSLATAQTIAVRDNPGLAQMQSRYAALSQMPSQMGALPDPVISFNAMNFPTDTFDRDQEPMTQLQIGISQDFPFPGKLALREAAAEFEAFGG